MASIFGTINIETSTTWRHHDQFYPNHYDRDRAKSRQKCVFCMITSTAHYERKTVPIITWKL